MPAASPDDWFAKVGHWHAEAGELRRILGSLPLEETIKWGAPCYVHDGRNIVGLGAFKAYFGLWFFQGALLDDDLGVLVNAQAGKTKLLRQWRMLDRSDIDEKSIRRYVKSAITLSTSGDAPQRRPAKTLDIPAELAQALGDKRVASAFAALSPGQQRAYADHVAEAKRESTRLRRAEKCVPMILEGIGLHDRYRR